MLGTRAEALEGFCRCLRPQGPDERESQHRFPPIRKASTMESKTRECFAQAHRYSPPTLSARRRLLLSATAEQSLLSQHAHPHPTNLRLPVRGRPKVPTPDPMTT